MSKLIVEMEMPKNCMECAFSTGCSFCEGYDDVCVLAPRDAEYKWNFSVGIKPSERPSWCPIVGELPDEPTVDAVPVVRCGRCEYYSNEMNCCSYVNGLQNVTKTDYCSYGQCADGERRSDADGESTRD